MAKPDVSLTFSNILKVSSALKVIAKDVESAAAIALTEEHELIMTEAKKLTPVDTGLLRSTGHVQPIKKVGDNLVSEGGFGGAASDYAIYVHERLGVNHPVGQAKFYETPFLEAITNMEDRLASSIRRHGGL